MLKDNFLFKKALSVPVTVETLELVLNHRIIQ